MNHKVEKVLLSPTQEEYLDIYHKYFVLKWEWNDIAKYHKCNKQKVNKAIEWVLANKLKFPSKALIRGAVDAIAVRLKHNRVLYNAEVIKKRYRDNGFIIALTKEIREDEKLIYELDNIYTDNSNDKNNLSAGQVLALIQQARVEDKK